MYYHGADAKTRALIEKAQAERAKTLTEMWSWLLPHSANATRRKTVR